ncbi:MAG: hypothetical protein ACI84E_002586, partial [Planctomycetota bacterium]
WTLSIGIPDDEMTKWTTLSLRAFSALPAHS